MASQDWKVMSLVTAGELWLAVAIAKVKAGKAC